MKQRENYKSDTSSKNYSINIWNSKEEDLAMNHEIIESVEDWRGLTNKVLQLNQINQIWETDNFDMIRLDQIKSSKNPKEGRISIYLAKHQ